MEMTPILQAEEALQKVTEIALGFGSIEKHESRRIMAGWQRAVRVTSRRTAAKSKQIDPAQMAAIGLGVRKVRKNG